MRGQQPPQPPCPSPMSTQGWHRHTRQRPARATRRDCRARGGERAQQRRPQHGGGTRQPPQPPRAGTRMPTCQRCQRDRPLFTAKGIQILRLLKHCTHTHKETTPCRLGSCSVYYISIRRVSPAWAGDIVRSMTVNLLVSVV